jgi:hypothetical protein
VNDRSWNHRRHNARSTDAIAGSLDPAAPLRDEVAAPDFSAAILGRVEKTRPFLSDTQRRIRTACRFMAGVLAVALVATAAVTVWKAGDAIEARRQAHTNISPVVESPMAILAKVRDGLAGADRAGSIAWIDPRVSRPLVESLAPSDASPLRTVIAGAVRRESSPSPSSMTEVSAAELAPELAPGSWTGGVLDTPELPN